eukprot:2247472-Rhodomonas_salina.1
MSGTAIGYGATRRAVLREGMVLPGDFQLEAIAKATPGISLRECYALSATDIASCYAKSGYVGADLNALSK